MLVVTRKNTEAIVVPSCNVSLAVQSVEGWRVRLAVSAQPEIPVFREEVSAQTNSQPQREMSMEGVRVLLADADTLLAKCYATHLSLLGFDVTTAGDGVECIARLREQIPNLVVLDAGLLWGRAEGVLALMMEQIDIPEIPVIVTYHQAGEQELPAVHSFRVSDYAAKPLTPSQLVECIRELLAFPINGDDGRR